MPACADPDGYYLEAMTDLMLAGNLAASRQLLQPAVDADVADANFAIRGLMAELLKYAGLRKL